MSTYELTLIPGRGNSILVELSSDRNAMSSLNEVNPDREYIYSDQPYRAELHGMKEEVESFSFYVNDVEIEQTLGADGKISLSGAQYPQGHIFVHNFGLVQIVLRIVFKGQTAVMLYSKFISVLVANTRTNLSVERMAEYIYCHREKLLGNGRLWAGQGQDQRTDSQKELDLQIWVLQDIVRVYRENIGYFRQSARCRYRFAEQVEHYDGTRVVSGSTLQYIVQHPEQLMRSASATGIRVGKQYFLPGKTLVKEYAPDYDIYENQLVVGFLRSVCRMVRRLRGEIGGRTGQFPDKREFENGYFLSVAFAFAATKRRLEKIQEQLTSLWKSLEELYQQYRQALQVSEREVENIPPPSPTLISVYPYRAVYEQMIRWFRLGRYDFGREDFILSMLRSNKLYEYYVLLKLYNYMEEKGYHLKKTDSYRYQCPDFSDLNMAGPYGMRCNNTFVFEKDTGSTELTLYYEPVIYSGTDKNAGENNLFLFRNLSLSYEKGETGRNYCPDYVLKITKNSCSRYIILDAKFSNRRSVSEYYVRELLFKYLISISVFHPEDRILGLVILNGKSNESEDMVFPHDIFDQVPDKRMVYPFAKMITLTENHEDMEHNAQLHRELLDNFFEEIASQ